MYLHVDDPEFVQCLIPASSVTFTALSWAKQQSACHGCSAMQDQSLVPAGLHEAPDIMHASDLVQYRRIGASARTEQMKQ